MTNLTRNYFDQKASGWLNQSYEKGETVAHARLDAVLKFVHTCEPKSILDVGCGDGRFLKMLPGVQIRTGVDYSNRMVEMARESDSSIQFEQVDLNEVAEKSILDGLGQFDVITMMGVVHYLVSPKYTIQKLRSCSHKLTHVVVSFRNRLFNTLESSQYFSSPLNQSCLMQLKEEIGVWTRVGLASDSLADTLNRDRIGQQLFDDANQNQKFEGVTDSYWNPDRFEHWRQFTPIDAIALMQQSGFKAEQIIPLAGRSPASVDSTSNDSIRETSDISSSSSFLIISSLQ